MNMPCLFLVLLNAIKERKEALRRPGGALAVPEAARH